MIKIDSEVNMSKQRKIIEVALDSKKDLKRAERLKSQYENDGYTLVHESCSLTTARFIYERQTTQSEG